MDGNVNVWTNQHSEVGIVFMDISFVVVSVCNRIFFLWFLA